jgi:hypothetical protein
MPVHFVYQSFSLKAANLRNENAAQFWLREVKNSLREKWRSKKKSFIYCTVWIINCVCSFIIGWWSSITSRMIVFLPKLRIFKKLFAHDRSPFNGFRNILTSVHMLKVFTKTILKAVNYISRQFGFLFNHSCRKFYMYI